MRIEQHGKNEKCHADAADEQDRVVQVGGGQIVGQRIDEIGADVDVRMRRRLLEAGSCRFRKRERDSECVPHGLVAIVEVARDHRLCIQFPRPALCVKPCLRAQDRAERTDIRIVPRPGGPIAHIHDPHDDNFLGQRFMLVPAVLLLQFIVRKRFAQKIVVRMYLHPRLFGRDDGLVPRIGFIRLPGKRELLQRVAAFRDGIDIPAPHKVLKNFFRDGDLVHPFGIPPREQPIVQLLVTSFRADRNFGARIGEVLPFDLL